MKILKKVFKHLREVIELGQSIEIFLEWGKLLAKIRIMFRPKEPGEEETKEHILNNCEVFENQLAQIIKIIVIIMSHTHIYIHMYVYIYIYIYVGDLLTHSFTWVLLFIIIFQSERAVILIPILQVKILSFKEIYQHFHEKKKLLILIVNSFAYLWTSLPLPLG